MITFENSIDIRCREPKTPTIARIRRQGSEYWFCIIGTPYGILRTAGGDVRVWKTASGARKALKCYIPL